MSTLPTVERLYVGVDGRRGRAGRSGGAPITLDFIEVTGRAKWLICRV